MAKTIDLTGIKEKEEKREKELDNPRYSGYLIWRIQHTVAGDSLHHPTEEGALKRLNSHPLPQYFFVSRVISRSTNFRRPVKE
ncbi:MAG: hypothetical protein RX316_00925 [bacterium]|nr:hypothetical protein [bacterium]